MPFKRSIISKTVVIIFCFVCIKNIHSQNTRLNNYNNIGWYNYFGTFKITDKLGIHSEYQFRRVKTITDWQQSLLRVGINYQIHPKIQLCAGYGWIETFAYGQIPINSLGKQFTEHRAFQKITLTDKISMVDVSHRFMLEQRWIGRYTQPNLTTEDEYIFSNRIRYLLRFQIPLKGKSVINKTPYLVMYNETFIAFGKNVNENVFDQNRASILLGYQFTNLLKLEVGYLNQVIQLGREVNSRNVFQHNNGLIAVANFNFDFSKKHQL